MEEVTVMYLQLLLHGHSWPTAGHVCRAESK